MSKISDAIKARKKRESEQRIKTIYEASKKLFFEKGYTKTTMDDICVEAQLSKPTIYQYFKNKDALYFSFMIPIIEDTAKQSLVIERKLRAGQYLTGKAFMKDVFKSFWHTYKVDPEAFLIVFLFQQTGMVWKLDDHTRSSIVEKGKLNYEIARRVFTLAMKMGLIKKIDEYHIVDILWGSFQGLVHLMTIKFRGKEIEPHLTKIMNTMENIYVDSICIK